MSKLGQRDNFSGDITVTAPTGGYTAGHGYLVKDSHYIARQTASAGGTCLMCAEGAIWAAKTAGTGRTLAVGDEVHLNTSGTLDAATATGSVLLNATVIKAAAATDTEVLIQLHGSISPTAT